MRMFQPDVAVVDMDEDNGEKNGGQMVLVSPKNKFVNEADEAGSKIDYRCEQCRGCNKCKKGEFTQKISLKEEFEQDLIQKSIRVDFKNNETTALLPFIGNPETKLCCNKKESLKVYNQQLKLL